MSLPTTLKPYQRKLSEKLCYVLDSIGASEKTRRIWRKAATTREILGTLKTEFSGDTPITSYVFGSSIEGTTTPGLRSDLDMLFPLEEWAVVQSPNETPSDKTESLLLITEDSRPGYAKLQLLVKQEPQTSIHRKDIDGFGKIYNLDFKERIVTSRYELQGITDAERHGPATTLPTTLTRETTDMVQAYRCQGWPNCAYKWLTRPRHYNWPLPELIKQMQSLSFFLVPVGHPFSKEQNKEWRLSLSLQERLLMFNLNPTQHKCYISLKMIKEDIIHSLVGEKTLTSYHCKTCLFYASEDTPNTFWVPENLLACIRYCLRCLHSWTVNWNCPNYFIPEENMFDGKIDSKLQPKLIDALDKLVSSDFEYLIHITCDNLGEELRLACLDELYVPATAHKECLIYQNIKLFCGEMFTTLAARNCILKSCLQDGSDNVLERLLAVIRRLRKTDAITEHTAEETRNALALVIPLLETSLLSTIFQMIIKHSSSNTVWNYLSNPKWDELSHASDTFTAKIKQATLFLMQGHGEASLKILYDLRSRLGPLTVSVCDCRPYKRPLDIKKLVSHASTNDLSKTEVQKKHIAPCVVFLPTEVDVIPTALRYEMIRSVGTQKDQRFIFSYWYDWAVVDSKFLLYFLLYLNHCMLNMRRDAIENIGNMAMILDKEQNLNHKETDCNLLGWTFKKEGLTRQAFQCFKMSLQMQQTHNAAIWHLIDSVLT